jgi:hypothetical protein
MSPAKSQSSLTTSPLQRLHDITTNLEHNSPMQEVNQSLQAFERVLQEWWTENETPRQMQIHDTSCVYESVTQRALKWQQYLHRNPDLAKTYDPEAWAAEEKAFGIVGQAISKANQQCYVIYTVSLQNTVFSHSWPMRGLGGVDTPEERAKFYRGDNMWHEFVIVLNHRKVRAKAARESKGCQC